MIIKTLPILFVLFVQGYSYPNSMKWLGNNDLYKLTEYFLMICFSSLGIFVIALVFSACYCCYKDRNSKNNSNDKDDYDYDDDDDVKSANYNANNSVIPIKVKNEDKMPIEVSTIQEQTAESSQFPPGYSAALDFAKISNCETRQ